MRHHKAGQSTWTPATDHSSTFIAKTSERSTTTTSTTTMTTTTATTKLMDQKTGRGIDRPFVLRVEKVLRARQETGPFGVFPLGLRQRPPRAADQHLDASSAPTQRPFVWELGGLRYREQRSTELRHNPPLVRRGLSLVLNVFVFQAKKRNEYILYNTTIN